MIKRFFKVEISKSFITFNFEDGKLISVNYSTSERSLNKNVLQGKIIELKRTDKKFFDEVKELLRRIFKYNRSAFNELCKFVKETKDIEFRNILKLYIE